MRTCFSHAVIPPLSSCFLQLLDRGAPGSAAETLLDRFHTLAWNEADKWRPGDDGAPLGRYPFASIDEVFALLKSGYRVEPRASGCLVGPDVVIALFDDASAIILARERDWIIPVPLAFRYTATYRDMSDDALSSTRDRVLEEASHWAAQLPRMETPADPRVAHRDRLYLPWMTRKPQNKPEFRRLAMIAGVIQAGTRAHVRNTLPTAEVHYIFKGRDFDRDGTIGGAHQKILLNDALMTIAECGALPGDIRIGLLDLFDRPDFPVLPAEQAIIGQANFAHGPAGDDPDSAHERLVAIDLLNRLLAGDIDRVLSK